MAVIENMAGPAALKKWREAMTLMSREELLAQQLVQRGAEHALQHLVDVGATAEAARDMLASIRSGLVMIHEVAAERHIDLLGYQAP
jgi:hypothetical protein